MMICIIIVAGHAAKLEEEILVRNQMTLLGAWSSIMDALFMFDNFFIYNFLAFHYYCIMSVHVER